MSLYPHRRGIKTKANVHRDRDTDAWLEKESGRPFTWAVRETGRVWMLPTGPTSLGPLPRAEEPIKTAGTLKLTIQYHALLLRCHQSINERGEGAAGIEGVRGACLLPWKRAIEGSCWRPLASLHIARNYVVDGC